MYIYHVGTFLKRTSVDYDVIYDVIYIQYKNIYKKYSALHVDVDRCTCIKMCSVLRVTNVKLPGICWLHCAAWDISQPGAHSHKGPWGIPCICTKPCKTCRYYTTGAGAGAGMGAGGGTAVATSTTSASTTLLISSTMSSRARTEPAGARRGEVCDVIKNTDTSWLCDGAPDCTDEADESTEVKMLTGMAGSRTWRCCSSTSSGQCVDVHKFAIRWIACCAEVFTCRARV